MTIREEQVIFRLNAMSRYDADTKVFVGYIPRLQVYSQARTKEELHHALNVTARQFIIACANKKILAWVMKEGGLQPSTPRSIPEVAEKDTEFVAVMGYEECENPIEVEVPLSLLAEMEAAVA